MKSIKASKEALAYIDPILRLCYFDCSDSANDAEKHEDRFNALVDDRLDIESYLKKFHLDEYVAVYQKFYDENLKQEGWIDKLCLESPACGDAPIQLSEIKHLLKLDARHV